MDSPASSPMQWTKDGFGLGFDPRLPEYPNYSMINDEEGTSSEAFYQLLNPVIFNLTSQIILNIWTFKLSFADFI